MAKTFKVGDKVRILDVSKIFIPFGEDAVDKELKNGKVFEIAQIEFDRDIRIDVPGRNRPFLITKAEFHAIELVDTTPTKKQRIEALESEVEALKVRVAELENAKIVAVNVKPLKIKTPNQRRKAVIERAKAFVADVEKGALCSSDRNAELGDGKFTYQYFTTKTQYHANKEKRVVTVLAKGAVSGRLLEKAIAKCAPGDVFNEHIGKAIALAKAYGLECPKEFTDAPQPDKVVVGTVAMHTNDEDVFAIEGVYPHHKYDMRHTSGRYFDMFKMPSAIEENYTILDDTEAQYE